MELIQSANWFGASKRDPRVVGLFSRHYSSSKSGKTIVDWLKSGITAPGETLILLTANALALFVWLKQKYVLNDQVGINCAVFRNEGTYLSSELILEAERLAWVKWPGERLYTYVNSKSIKSNNPGFCFKAAGWKNCGKTKAGLIILEKLPNV